MIRRLIPVLSLGLLLAGPALARGDEPYKKAFYDAARAAEKAAEQGEYLSAAKGLEAYVAEWGSEPAAGRMLADAKTGIERYRGLASHWILVERKPAGHLKAFLRDLLTKPKGYHFGCSATERARSFAFALEHDPWLKGQAALAFPMGVKVQSPGRKATEADERAFMEELAKTSEALGIPMRADGAGWKLTLNLEVAPQGSLPGSRMTSIRATGNCKLLDAAGETVTTLRVSGVGLRLDQASGGVKASQKMAADLLDKVVTHFLTRASQRPD